MYCKARGFFSIVKIMKLSAIRLGFIGFGHMAQVIFQAIDHAKWIPRSQITFIRRDPKKMRENEEAFNITSTTLENLVKLSDLLLLCVRPNQIEGLLADLAKIGVQGKMIVSILAGIQISFFQKHLGSEIQILRIMPNLPAAVSEGMTLFSFGPNPSVEFKSFSHLLFSCMGEIAELGEELMDIGCAMAGSGPGFVFRLIEAMARLGEKEGMSYEEALKIAAQTFLGSARLILKGGVLPAKLIEQIATPNGTTEAGFNKMKELHLERGFQAVIEAAAARSRALAV
jgi:pyrroline-5-carboxylate reductase